MEVESVQSEFDESVLDIVGLSAYEPGRLPPWLRERLLNVWRRPEDRSASDASIVDKYVGGWGVSWLTAWGQAVVEGKEVFICESEALFEPVTLADTLECGLQFVDPCIDYGNYTLCFTATRIQRRSAYDDQLAGNETPVAASIS